jgi:hypothetical protein
VSDIVIGTLVTLLGLLGVFLAGNALDSGMESFGLGLAAFAVLYVFWLIKLHFDRPAAGTR